MQDNLTQNKKLKPRCLSCSFFICHVWFLDTRKDNDTDRKLGFALLIDLEWYSSLIITKKYFSEERTRFLTGTTGKTWSFSGKIDVLVEKVKVKPHPCWGNVKLSILYPVFFSLWFFFQLVRRELNTLTNCNYNAAGLALSVERLTTEQRVMGSIPWAC